MSGLFDQVVNYSPPLLTSGQVNYDGTWNAATNTPTLVSPPDALSKGDYYVVSAAGTQFGISFAVGDWIISNGTAWEKVDLTDAVSSVFGRTGAVVGDSTDYSAVGLTNTAIGAANPSSGAFTSLSSSSTTTLNGTTIPASKTLVVTTDKLSALAATTSAELAGVISDETGSGSLVFANSPTLVSPALGTPSALVGTNITGTAAAFNINGTVGATTPSTVAATSVTALSDSGYQAVVGQLTSGDRVGISGQASGSGTALVFFDNAQTTFRPAIFDASSHSLKISGVEKASVTSTGLQGAIGASSPAAGAFTTVSATTPIAVASGGTGVSTSTGTTNVVLSNSPTLVTPILGTPQSGTLTSCTGLPISTGVSGLGTGVATALAVNVGSAGAPVLFNGALGTPSSGTVTNLTGTASININGTVGATTPSTVAATTLSVTPGSGVSGLTVTGNGAGFFADFVATNLADSGIRIRNTGTGGRSYNLSTATDASGNIPGAGLYLYDNTGAKLVWSADTNSRFNVYNGLAVTGALSSTTGANFATSSGNVGIGTSSPDSKLVVGALPTSGYTAPAIAAFYSAADTEAVAWFARGGVANPYLVQIGVNQATGYGEIQAAQAGVGYKNLILNRQGGNVGIGTTSPGSKLAVSGSTSDVVAAFTRTGGASCYVTMTSGASSDYTYETATERTGANTGIYYFGGAANTTFRWRQGGYATLMNLDTVGLSVTGALSCTGALAIGNTVNTVSPTSPNRTVTIVIGGTTYYLAAKTTND